MSEHIYRVGQTVRLLPSSLRPEFGLEGYTITSLRPLDRAVPSYLIHSLDGERRRVVTEREIEVARNPDP